jgi:outer membrane receptor protein involved in Fe transport
MKNRHWLGQRALIAALLTLATGASAQQASPAIPPVEKTKGVASTEEEPVFQLSPFEVTSEGDSYTGATTLAGNRLNTELRDLGNAITVITPQFMKDIGATDNSTLLQYTTNTEVGSIFGNFVGGGDGSLVDESVHFTNPNANTRIRGLTAADNTRDYFMTDIPWDSYNVDGVDLQRGPNSILFGQGSPAGIINTRTKPAMFRNANEVSFRFDDNGSARLNVDFNRVLIKDQLALRIAALDDDTKFQQKPAYNKAQRLFGAVRYEPGFLKKGSARTIIKADIEWGNVESNNPRQLPPLDGITPWFQTGTYAGRNVANQPFNFPSLNRLTVIPSQNEDDNTGLPFHGFNRPAHNGPASISGTPNEYYQPWIGRTFGGAFGNPSFNFDGSTAGQGTGFNWEPTTFHGISSTGGSRVTGIGGMPFQRAAGVSQYADFAQNARLPFSSSGVYRDKSLTDSSIFDFYNNLLDGPTKNEWQDFRTYNVSLAQTFFHDHLGFEGTYNNEWYKNGNVRLLSGDQQAITIDMNSVYSDGTPTGKNGQAFGDGTPNPNVGKAVVSDSAQYGNNAYVSNRENSRLTIFGDYDFYEKGNAQNWFTHLLGRHVLTALIANDEQNTDTRSWSRYSIDDKSWQLLNNSRVPGDSAYVPLSFMAAQMAPYSYVYLGQSMKGMTSASGANLPRISIVPTIASGSVRAFDATWKPSTNPADPSYVNPGAYWHNDYYPTVNPIDGTPDTRGDNTQSENPANYVGWRNIPVNVLDSEAAAGNRDANTHDASLSKSKISSKAFNWQANFWEKAIVATFGIRKDVAKSWASSLNTSSASSLAANNYRLNLSPDNYKLKTDPDNRIEVTSKAWTAVAHLNQFGDVMKKMPLQISLFYNYSTDFQPAAQRVDIYGESLAAPSGKTRDYGILLETNDGKYSLKINKYETDSTNQSSSALNYAWFIGSSQAWAANWANRFEFNWTADNNSGAVPVNDPTNSEYNYAQAPGESLADAQAREAKVIGAWRAWQKSVDPRFYKAWGINLNDPSKSVSAVTPNGFTATEDSHSEGYEIEFNANPTKNWRLTLNASEAKAQRTNIGGTNLRAFTDAYVKALANGAPGSAGDLRIWWGGAGNETTLQEWYSGNQPFGSVYAQRSLQEGSDVPELREWRGNLISNYSFDRGALRGFNVGGAIRYESNVTIGYKPILLDPSRPLDDSPANTTYDMANPYKGPAETNFDLWVGYSRRIWKNIDWNIQLNVRNVANGNDLIVLTTEPDGSGATYRIKPPQVIQLTNTFKF